MSDESLLAVWASDGALPKQQLMSAVGAALEADRATRRRELGIQVTGIVLLAVLCPALVWCAAHGVTPLVRGGYTLMAVGTGIVIFSEWMYLSWSRRALPGPIDARSQLENSAVMLFRQSALLRSAGLWCAPIFVGAAFIATWLYEQRGHTAGYVLGTTVAVAWCVSVVGGRSKAVRLDEQRGRLEALLSNLQQP